MQRLLLALLLILSATLSGFGMPLFGASQPTVDDILAAARKEEEADDLAGAIGRFSMLLPMYDDNLEPEKKKEFTKAFKHAGDLCHVEQRFIEGLEFYTYGLKSASSYGDDEYVSRCLGNIANIYARFEDTDRAFYYYNKGYKIALDKNDNLNQYKFLINMGILMATTGKPEEARELLRKIKLVPPATSPDQECQIETLQGHIASAEKNYSAAVFYHRKALEIFSQTKLDSIYFSDIHLNLAKTFELKNDTDSAMAHYQQALKTALAHDIKGDAVTALLAMAAIYRSKGETEQANQMQLKANALNDSIYNRSTFNANRNKLVEYEDMLNEANISDLSETISTQRLVMAFSSILLVVLLLSSFLFYHHNRRLKFANRKLVEKNHELIYNEKNLATLRHKYMEAIEADPPKVDGDGEKESYTSAAESQDTTPPSSLSEESGVNTEDNYLSEQQLEILMARVLKVFDDGESIYNPDFSLAILAQKVKSNTKYISWGINKTTGKNFKTLLNEHRIREASRRLEDQQEYGNFTIKAIAESVGYRSSTSFIQSFKKIVGMTPNVYQKLSRQEDQDEDKA